jgi:hypothetical protein
MIYGGGFADKDGQHRLREGFTVPADAPPLFLAVADDDKDLSVDPLCCTWSTSACGGLPNSMCLPMADTDLASGIRDSPSTNGRTGLGTG